MRLSKDEEYIATNLADKWWRINNLYHITNKEGQKVLFQPNPVQVEYIKECMSHPRCIILKSRQLGISTCSAIVFGLDDALWNENYCYNLSAHTLDDAKGILATKVGFAYDNLSPFIKKLVPLANGAKKIGKESAEFANGSKIYTDTAVRSGTVQYLHVSELAKLSLKNPEGAKEIIAGSLNAIGANGNVTIESTAEGPVGVFYDMCTTAMDLKAAKAELTSLDFNFIFFAWFQDVTNMLSEEDASKVTIAEGHDTYFDKIGYYYKERDPDKYEKFFPLNIRQKAWYIKKCEEQGDAMGKEQPSTPEESFLQSIEGAYYSKQFESIDKDGRVMDVPYMKGVPVNTSWDLGYNDSTAIWFYQLGPAGAVHIIDYYKNDTENIEFYIDILMGKRRELGYTYGRHFGPHDLAQTTLATGKSTFEVAQNFGLTFTIVPNIKVKEGIDETRRILNRCYFDKKRTATDNHMVKGNDKYSGVSCLRTYRKEYDNKAGVYRDHPLHNYASDPADSFRYLALSIGLSQGKAQARKVKRDWSMR